MPAVDTLAVFSAVFFEVGFTGLAIVSPFFPLTNFPVSGAPLMGLLVKSSMFPDFSAD